MSAADQRKVVAALRGVPLEGWERWTPAALARAAGMGKLECDAAIRALRYAGKIKFGALELSASMMEEYRAKAGDEAGEGRASESPVGPVSRGADARSSAATSELMDATAGETAPSATPCTFCAGQGGHAWEGARGDYHFDVCRSCNGDGANKMAGETAPNHETATVPSVHPGEHEGVAAAGGIQPLPDIPGHTHPVVRDTADEAGARAATTECAPASSSPDATLGQQLLVEIEAYLARTRMGASLLGDLALTHPGYVNLLRKRGTAREKTAVPMRAFMARWPDGTTRDKVAAWRHEQAFMAADAMGERSIAAAPGKPVADQVRDEAAEQGERRRMARKLSATVHDPISPNVVAVQAALLAQPEDAFVFLRRKWPTLLRGVIAQARAAEVTPATMLARVVAAGLAAEAVQS